MPGLNKLKTALKRLIAGLASEADPEALRTRTSGVPVTGERAVAIGGNASDVIITTGDQNIVLSLKGADAATVQSTLSSITPTRLHEVPPPPADFTGRVDEQRELLAAIEDRGITISGLQGLGGIGKTALALKLVEQLKPRYPDAQFYLDLKGASAQPLSVSEALAHVVRAYYPAAKLPDSATELRSIYLSLLDGQRALLLMDNAANAAQVEPLIPPASCVLLVTSRWHFTLPGLAAKNLDTLSPTAARDLLLAIAPRIGEWADEIAALCGRVPLALRLAASAMVKYVNIKPADYIQRLQDQKQRLQLIEASLNLSYELLRGELRDRWRLLAVFPDTFAFYSAAAVWEVDENEAQDTLGELIAASLVEWDETSGRCRLHDLARLFADAKLDTEERDVAQKRFAIHCMDLLASANKFYSEGGESLLLGLTVFDLEWTNIQAAHAWVVAQHDSADADVIRLGTAYAGVGASILVLRQHARERICWLEIALAAARRVKDRNAEVSALGNLGVAYDDLGETRQAIQCNEQQLAIARELGDRKLEGIALCNLGVIYKNLGQARRAIQLQEQALLIDREVGDRKGEGDVLGNLGTAYALLGETRQSLQFYEQQLAIMRELGERRGEGIALGNLGTAYWNLGETHLAMRLYEQSLSIAREIGDRGGEGIALYNLSVALNELGHRAQAIQHAEQSLTIFEQTENPNAAQVRAQLVAWRGETSENQPMRKFERFHRMFRRMS
ncbi:MAG TPA: tetratricopeptide repeat protein [Pyrinomonadaceae bacterium]|nr:tetratricopeptide repeat protein [Pyrinomonadaceae bacterium]